MEQNSRSRRICRRRRPVFLERAFFLRPDCGKMAEQEIRRRIFGKTGKCNWQLRSFQGRLVDFLG